MRAILEMKSTLRSLHAALWAPHGCLLFYRQYSLVSGQLQIDFWLHAWHETSKSMIWCCKQHHVHIFTEDRTSCSRCLVLSCMLDTLLESTTYSICCICPWHMHKMISICCAAKSFLHAIKAHTTKSSYELVVLVLLISYISSTYYRAGNTITWKPASIVIYVGRLTAVRRAI